MEWVVEWVRREEDVEDVECQKAASFASRLLRAFVEVGLVALDAILT